LHLPIHSADDLKYFSLIYTSVLVALPDFQPEPLREFSK